MATIKSKCDVRGGVSSMVTLTDGRPPWDDAEQWLGNAWKVLLKYRGQRMLVDFFTGEALGEPTTADVLDCLLIDASCAGESFADFCADLGYDEDSRLAEATWRAVNAQTKRLRRLLGDDFDTFFELERL